MDLTKSPTKNELIAYLKEQHELSLRGPRDKPPSFGARQEEWKAYGLELEAYRLTEEGHKGDEAWENLTKAVTYANEHFSEWHLARIRSTAGISKDEWFFLSNPDLLNLDVLEAALKK